MTKRELPPDTTKDDLPRKSSGKDLSPQEIQEELAYLHQKCSSLAFRGHYSDCVKAIEADLQTFYFKERWVENFFAALRLHKKCYPSLDKDQPYEEYLTALLRKNGIPFIFADLIKSGGPPSWSSEHFQKLAAEYTQQKNFDYALACADIVIKLEPGKSSAYLVKGWILEDMGRGPDAAALYLKALELNENNRHALSSIAKYYIQSNPRKALEYINRAIDLRPGEAAYHAIKSDVLRKLGDRAGAVDVIDKAIADDPKNADYPYKKAELLLEEGRSSAAIPYYRMAVTIDEKHLPSLLRLAELCQDSQPELALKLIETVVSLEPENRPALLICAKLKQRTGDVEAAIRQYEALLSLDPSSHEAMAGLGALYFSVGDFQQSADVLSRAIELERGLPQYHFDKGKALQALGQNDQAAKEYKTAIAKDKAFAPAWAALGRLCGEQDVKQACGYYSKAVALDPENAFYHAEKARLLTRLPDSRAEAIQALNSACKHDPGNAELHRELSRLLEESDNFASASDHLLTASGLDKKNADTWYRLARLNIDTHPEAALTYINRAASLDINNSEYLFFKAKVIVALGQGEQSPEELQRSFYDSGDVTEYEEELNKLMAGDFQRVALMYMEHAVELEPTRPDYLCARAHLLFRMGHKNKARDQYEALLKKNPDQHEALFGVARILADQKDAKAIVFFDRAAALAPDAAEYHAERAAFLAREDENYGEAIKAYSTAIALNKQAWRVILEKARLLDSHGEKGPAIEEYRHVLLVYRKSAEAAARLGVMLADIRPEFAQVYLDQAVRLEPDNYLHRVWRAKALAALGNDEAASEDLRAAVALGGELPDVYFTLAKVLENAMPETALQYLRAALEQQPSRTEALLLAGEIHLRTGEYDPAKEYFQRAAALDSKCHQAHERLAEIAFMRGAPACDELVDAACVSNPDCPSCTFLRARILDELQGNTGGALSFAEMAVKLEPDSVAYREKLVELLRKKRSLIRLPLEKHKLDKLRRALDLAPDIPPPPDFEDA